MTACQLETLVAIYFCTAQCSCRSWGGTNSWQTHHFEHPYRWPVSIRCTYKAHNLWVLHALRCDSRWSIWSNIPATFGKSISNDHGLARKERNQFPAISTWAPILRPPGPQSKKRSKMGQNIVSWVNDCETKWYGGTSFARHNLVLNDLKNVSLACNHSIQGRFGVRNRHRKRKQYSLCYFPIIAVKIVLSVTRILRHG